MANYRNDFADVNLETGTICRNFMNHSIGSGDALGDRFGVRVFRNGEPVSLGGTVAGYFVRNTTGETVVISSGVVSGNEAYVTLPAACYAVEGSFTLAIKVTSGSETVTMRIIDGVVSRTNTSVTVDPGTLVPSIETLISAINSAVGQIPVNYNASFAPAYSASSTYAVGDYVVYDGYLWRCTTAITETESWTAAHWTKVALASDVSDLKSALQYYAVDGEEEYSTFIQGNRSTSAPETVTSRNDRCTTGKLFHLYKGDVVNVTGIASGHKFVLASSTGYDSGWKTGDFSYTVTEEMYIFGNEAASNGSDAILPSSVTTKIEIVDNSSRISKNEDSIIDIMNALTQANIIDLGSQLFQNTGYYIKNNQAVGSYCDVSVHVENENYACVLAEHIAKGQKFYFVGQVTGANGKLYAWLDSEHNVVSNSGDTASISGAVIECPVDNGTLVCSANTVDVALKVIAIKEDCNDTYAYFSNGLQPTFTETLNLGSTSISVKFPNAEFRLYRKDGTRFVATTAYTNQTFTVSNLQKLIYDLSDSTVKVISMTEVRFNTITLLAVISEGVDGAFACFYNRYVNARDWNKTQLTAYFSSGQSPYFQVINITSTAKIKVLFPTGDFRIYGLTGMFYSTSSYGGTEFVVETLKKLVYDIANNVITVVSNTASGNYINLLSVEGQGISGLLAKYFYANNDYYTRQELYDVNSANFGTDVKLLFYSDVHGSVENVKRIINKAESYNVNAIVCGGDIVPFNIGQGLSWYEELAATTTKDMLTCVGNHDVWSNADTQTLATKSDVYNAVIAPMVARVSDIVQPTGASTNYDLYFYKDYGGIRMIFLDAMVTTGGVSVGWWDTTQLAWLENVLADAKTNSKSVVIVAHPPFDKNIAIRDNSSPVNSWIDYRNYNLYEGIHLPESAMEAVKDFIDGGGKFVCWLSGHVHVDSLLTATGYTGQVMINIMSARYNYHPDGTAYYLSSYSREKWFDSYDYIAFDTTHKMIKVIRIGYCEDGSMRRRERFCYDYGNKTLLSVS